MRFVSIRNVALTSIIIIGSCSGKLLREEAEKSKKDLQRLIQFDSIKLRVSAPKAVRGSKQDPKLKTGNIRRKAKKDDEKDEKKGKKSEDTTFSKAIDLVIDLFRNEIKDLVIDEIKEQVVETFVEKLTNRIKDRLKDQLDLGKNPMCVESGDACWLSSPCCDGLSCSLSTLNCESDAVIALPEVTEDTCVAEGTTCKVLTPCCGGLSCNLATFQCEVNSFLQDFPTSAPTTTPKNSPLEFLQEKMCVTDGNRCKLHTPCCDGSTCETSSLTCVKETPSPTSSSAPSQSPSPAPTDNPTINTKLDLASNDFTFVEDNNCVKKDERCMFATPCCSGHRCDVSTRTCQSIETVASSLDDLKDDAASSLGSLVEIATSIDVSRDGKN